MMEPCEAQPFDSGLTTPDSILRFRLIKQESRVLDHEMLWGSLALVGLLVAWLVPDSLLSLAPHCQFKEIMGFPCMTCGSTRAVRAFVHGDIITALHLNPLASLGLILVVPYTIYAISAVLLKTRRIRFSLGKPWSNGLRVLVVLAVVLNWIYLIWDGR